MTIIPGNTNCEVNRLANAIYVVGHELKNRLAELNTSQVRDALTQRKPGAQALALSHLRRVEQLYSVAEFLACLPKFIDGKLPRAWADPKFIDEWPRGFNSDCHLLPIVEASRHCAITVVADHVLADATIRERFQLREIVDGVPHETELPLQETLRSVVPPFTEASSRVAVSMLLLGLTKIVRNATKHVTNRFDRRRIFADYGRLHIDFEVVSTENGVAVSVFNPIASDHAPPVSSTVQMLQTVFAELRAVALEPPRVVLDYRHRKAEQPYALSSFFLYPTLLRFEDSAK